MQSNQSAVPMRRWAIGICGVMLAIIAAGGLAYSLAMSQPELTPLAPGTKVVSLAGMGDSNTHSFQDSISLSAARNERGGPLRARTFQWGEVIARLRPNEVDQGPWGAWGVSGAKLAALDLFGLPVGRAPRKEDYFYNFANNGAPCKYLMETRQRQAPRLVALMDRSPERWVQGVVVIRMGIGEMAGVLDHVAKDPAAPELRAAIQACTGTLARTVDLIHRSHPSTHIVLVSPFNDTHDAANLDRWQSAVEVANIEQAYAAWDAALQRIVAASPQTVSVFNDRAWFASQWGGRGPQGKPDYRTVTVGKLNVTHSLGNEPTHSMLADDHNGLVWNVLWAQAMTRHLHDVAKLPVTPITDAEVARFVESLTSTEGAGKVERPASPGG